MEYWEDIIRCFLGFVVLVTGLILGCFAGFLIASWIVSGIEYKTWNKLHNTNYSHYEWFSGADFIKDYHNSGHEQIKKEVLAKSEYLTRDGYVALKTNDDSCLDIQKVSEMFNLCKVNAHGDYEKIKPKELSICLQDLRIKERI